MKYVKLGNTGLDVSPLCLGCMGFGDPNSKGQYDFSWVINEEESRKVIKKALDLGINFFDTANVYSDGESERILGRAIKDYANRDDVVIATKVFVPMRKGPNSGGLSRKEIFAQLENSLARLQMDYVDLYIIHRWDPNTPIEETMEALHDLIKMGKIRYIGASSMAAWQFAKAQAVAEKNNWTKFISMQNHLNLIYREEEREMMPLCIDQKVAVTPFRPLASGRLLGNENTNSLRMEKDAIVSLTYDKTEKQDQIIIDRVAEIAEKYNVKRAQIALAWLLHKEGVVSALIGASDANQLEDSIPAIDIKLTTEDITYLEEPYIAHEV